jgi:hypothetical protein
MVFCGLIGAASTIGGETGKIREYADKLIPAQGIAGTILALSSIFAIYKTIFIMKISFFVWVFLPLLIFLSGIGLGLVLGFDFICKKISTAEKMKGIISQLEKYKTALAWVNLSYGYLGIIITLFIELLINSITESFTGF